jgi:NAD(P)-dependent dehydrogenase (short-subunit alcohol dehydrogenase family)
MSSYSDIFRLDGKNVMITGGLGLIGTEITKALVEFGARVFVADTNKEKAADISKHPSIKFVQMDITDESSVDNAIKVVIADCGRIDVLINSAYPRTADWGVKFEKVLFDSWKKNINDQLGGYFLCCQRIAEQMKHNNGGSIINISSIYGVVAPDFSIYEGTEMTMPAAYSAIKGGAIAFTRYLATYYAKDNIRANSVSPGGIFDNQPPAFVEKYCRQTPLDRMGNPEDIVGAVVFLASDASSYVTGLNLMVDGGWTAQ